MKYENEIICGDSLSILSQVPNDVATLVITSPPYNVNASQWEYETIDDNQPYKDYLLWLSDIFNQCYRVLRTGGRLIVNIDAMTNRQDDKDVEYIRDIRTDLANLLKPIGFNFFGEHIWYKSNKDPTYNGGQFNGKKTAWGSYCLPSNPAVRRNHEYILVYSKKQFKLDKDSMSKDADITPKEFQNYIASTWYMQGETKNMIDHPAPFPLELPLRCCKLYSYVNDLVIDPFSGTGTTCCAAMLSKRRYLGIDLGKKYCDYAKDRIAEAQEIL